ncbi:MAG: PIG-L family deacetylase [Deltaproteobacteria bacterium]|nr:PIG-L family deacetylase [Deltaproteobacteria bacterium]
MKTKKRILILSPHTDDGEFGCGGTIARFVEAGKEVHYLAFSDCEKSLPPDMPRDTLVHELRNATGQLGIPSANVRIEQFEVRCFERDRQEILEVLVDLQRRLRPDLVFLPSPRDLHQDHHTVAMEGLRAFKLSATVLAYEMPWNNLTFETTCFVPLEESQLRKKIAALACYESQKDRFYATEEFIRALALTRGTQIGTRHAETFEVLRWIVND